MTDTDKPEVTEEHRKRAANFVQLLLFEENTAARIVVAAQVLAEIEARAKGKAVVSAPTVRAGQTCGNPPIRKYAGPVSAPHTEAREQPMTDKPVTVAGADRRRANATVDEWLATGASREGTANELLREDIALALVETRARAEAPWRECHQHMTAQRDRLAGEQHTAQARIAELEDAEGIRWARMNARIAELEAENKRLTEERAHACRELAYETGREP